MEWVRTQVFKEPWDVDLRLKELGLERNRLLAVRDVAIGQAANATPHHCVNAAGTFAYQQCRRNLRLSTWYMGAP